MAETPSEITHLMDPFIDALKSLPSFDTDLYARKLQKASTYTGSMKFFNAWFPYGDSSQTNTGFDDLDCNSNLDLLGMLAIARGMYSNNDDYGFHQIVNNVNISPALRKKQSDPYDYH